MLTISWDFSLPRFIGSTPRFNCQSREKHITGKFTLNICMIKDAICEVLENI